MVVLAVVPDVCRRDPRVVECPDARGDKGGIVTIGDDEKAEGRKDDACAREARESNMGLRRGHVRCTRLCAPR